MWVQRDGFLVMTLIVNFNMRPILYLFCIELGEVSQPLNRKITVVVLCVNMHLKSYLEKQLKKIIPFSFLLIIFCKQIGKYFG